MIIARNRRRLMRPPAGAGEAASDGGPAAAGLARRASATGGERASFVFFLEHDEYILQRGALAERRLHLGGRAGGGDAAVRQEHQPVEVLGLVHVMSGADD